MSAATRLAMLQEATAPFQERAFALQTLEVVRLLCEGHNVAMQDFLQDQPHEAAAIDVWFSICELLIHASKEGLQHPAFI